MAKKVKYYLDETDQIEVDGHTLSRLYLAEVLVENEFTSGYAVFGEDNAGREMGGYVESLDNISNGTDCIFQSPKIAWVDEKSKVYGTSRIQSGAHI